MSAADAFDPEDARHVAMLDELSLWSSFAGQLLLEHLPFDVTRVLDLGCGTGFPLLELAERLGPRARVVGLDPWLVALERAEVKRDTWGVPSAAVACGDGGAMPFRDQAFDLVVSNLGVNNFANVGAALAECRRVLRPGGRLALSTNLVGHMRELYQAFERALVGDPQGLERLERHVAHRATVESLGASLAAAGFRVEAVHRREVALRYADAAALLDHHFIRLGFRPAWEEVAASEEAMARLRDELDRMAGATGEIRLTVPLAMVLARRDGTPG